MTNEIINTDQVSEGLFQLFKQHPVLLEKSLDASEVHTEQAVALLLAFAQKRWAVWQECDELTRSTARAFFMDFFAKISFPRPGEYLGCTWQVQPGSAVEQALCVLAQEIAKNHPRQSLTH